MLANIAIKQSVTYSQHVGLSVFRWFLDNFILQY